jgi:hypothetical protein
MQDAMKKSLAAGIYALRVCRHRAFSWKQEWMYSQRIFHCILHLLLNVALGFDGI